MNYIKLLISLIQLPQALPQTGHIFTEILRWLTKMLENMDFSRISVYLYIVWRQQMSLARA